MADAVEGPAILVRLHALPVVFDFHPHIGYCLLEVVIPLYHQISGEVALALATLGASSPPVGAQLQKLGNAKVKMYAPLSRGPATLRAH